MKKNINARISTELSKEIQNKIVDLHNAFLFLVEVSPEEKRQYQFLTQRGVGFIRDTQRTSRKKNEIISPLINPTDFEADFTYFEDLKAYSKELGLIKQKLDDNILLVGQQVMRQANEVYNAVKRAA
jgi:hypothetical protein